MALTNDTISGNTAEGNGGGISNTGTLSANNCTVAMNVADSDLNGAGDGGGIFNAPGGTATLSNTILGTNIDDSPVAKSPDCTGTIVSQGFNLVQNTTGCTIGGIGNITGRDPRLGPLQNNGGLTLTHALVVGLLPSLSSPAIDAGSGNSCLPRDQRGTPRPLDGNSDGTARCDIGAFEASGLGLVLTRGIGSVEPSEATVGVGEHVSYVFAWTVPEASWRVLDSLQFRILDDERIILWVRFQEVTGAPGTFSVVDPKNGNPGPAFAPGRPTRLETEAATLYLAGSAVDGPPGPRVELTLDLSFKPSAAGRDGRTYQIEVLAIDDAGEEQGFTPAGVLTIE